MVSEGCLALGIKAGFSPLCGAHVAAPLPEVCGMQEQKGEGRFQGRKVPCEALGGPCCVLSTGNPSARSPPVPCPCPGHSPGIHCSLLQGSRACQAPPSLQRGDLCWAPGAKLGFKCFEKQKNVQVFHTVKGEEI